MDSFQRWYRTKSLIPSSCRVTFHGFQYKKLMSLMTWMIWRYHDFRNLHIYPYLPSAHSPIFDPFRSILAAETTPWIRDDATSVVPRAAAGAPKACSTRGTLGATRRKLQWKQRSAWRLRRPLKILKRSPWWIRDFVGTYRITLGCIEDS